MNVKKDLIIIGCHLDREYRIEVLRNIIERISDTYDILLSSHYSIPEEIQKLVKYCIYNSVNDLIEQGGCVVWHSYNDVYIQYHKSKSINPSYAVYQLIRCPLSFMKSMGYNSFFYMEGDLLISRMDVDKILNMKLLTDAHSKKAAFFNTVADKSWWDCQLFYSDIDFFLNNTPELQTSSDFIDWCGYIGAESYLESFLYHSIYNRFPSKVVKIDETPPNYLPNSLLNMSDANDISSDTTIEIKTYNSSAHISLLVQQGTSKVFIVCIQDKIYNGEIQIEVNNHNIMNVDTHLHYCELLDISDVYNLRISLINTTSNNCEFYVEKSVSKACVLTNTDYIRFNN